MYTQNEKDKKEINLDSSSKPKIKFKEKFKKKFKAILKKNKEEQDSTRIDDGANKYVYGGSH